MAMFDLRAELNTFYDDHVRLKSEREKLADYRDVNLKRLNEGLNKLGEQYGTAYAHPIDHCDQGSYAMHTLNRDPDNHYDLDEAIIFRKEDLPASAYKARQHVAAAFQATGVKFAKDPEARTNAVTIWYEEGYHIDFALYRTYTDETGKTIIEHAGPEWNEADPVAMTDWFIGQVHALSPTKITGATVRENQVRRVVRLLKRFTKSRPNWNLPGGLIISALVVECYRPDHHRDDVALYETMHAIRDRLAIDQEVINPIYPDQQLTSKTEYWKQVVQFKERLDSALNELNVLFDTDCTRAEAMRAWHWVFQHVFWKDEPSESGGSNSSRLSIGTPTGAPGLIRDTGTYGA